VHKLGGYRVQGREAASAEALRADARVLQEAGADLLVLECVPRELAARITAEVAMPVIGIGAGAGCDGQVLVLYDILGIAGGTPPRFVANFLTGGRDVAQAVAAYVEAVRARRFPAPEQSYG
jgi:3-methyl-2-oxobutanoate hydroxymethyltransferase